MIIQDSVSKRKLVGPIGLTAFLKATARRDEEKLASALAKVLARALARDLARALARDLARTLTRALALARAFGRGLGQEPSEIYARCRLVSGRNCVPPASFGMMTTRTCWPYRPYRHFNGHCKER